MTETNQSFEHFKDNTTDKPTSSPLNITELYRGLPDVSTKTGSQLLPAVLDFSANPYESPSSGPPGLGGDSPTNGLTPSPSSHLKRLPGGDVPPTNHENKHPWVKQVSDKDQSLKAEIKKDAGNLGGNEKALTKEAFAVQRQEETDASKNNGRLTSGEHKQLLSEEAALKKQITSDDKTGGGTGPGDSKNPISDNGKVIQGAYPGRGSGAFQKLEQELGGKGTLHEQNMYLNVGAPGVDGSESNQKVQEQLKQTMATIDSDVKAGIVPTLSLRMGKYSDIADGKDDAFLNELSKDLKSAGGKVVLRFDWEMNCKKHFGSGTPDQFKAAWQHTYDLFQTNGAKNVLFDYCPTGKAFELQKRQTETYADQFYPGNQYVNMIGCDAYDGIGGSKATTPSALFDNAYQFAENHGKPFMIGETGAASSLGANKDALYVQQMAEWMESHPNAVGISWFSSDTGVGGKFALDDYTKELDAYIKYFVDNPYFGGEGN